MKAESVEKPKVTVPTDTTSAMKKTVPDSSKSVSESQKTVVVQKQDTVSQPMGTESVMKETKSAAKETTLVAKENAAERKVTEPVSKKGKRADKSTVAAPKDTSLLPKETVPGTTKTVSVATSKVTAPKETVDDPKKAVSEKEKAMSVQQQETAIQPKETGSPPKDTKLVAKETVLRTKVTEPVSKKAESVAKPKVSVPTDTSSVLKETVPHASKSVSESQKTVIVHHQDTASQPTGTESVMKETESVAKETTLVAKEIAPEVKVAEPVSKKGKRADKSTVAASKDTSVLPKETVPETTKTVSVATSSVTALKETVHDPIKIISETEKAMSVQQQETAIQPKETVSPPKDTKLVAKEAVLETKVTKPVSKKAESVEKPKVSVPTDTSSVLKETVPDSSKSVSQSQKTVVVQQQDTVLPPTDAVSGIKETESVAKETTLVAKEIAAELKVTEQVSKKGKQADKSTVAAPKDTSLLPKETVPETTKTVSVATSKVTAPKETVDDPKKAVSEREKAMSVQQQETAIQPKETVSPPKDTKLVAKKAVLETKVAKPVSKTAESVEKPKMSVPTDTSSVLKETVPDSSKSVSESQKTVVVQQQNTTSQTTGTELVMKETESVAKETTLVAKEIAPEVKVAEPVSKKGKRADKSTVAAPKDTSLLPKETVPETTKTVSVATSKVTAPKETVDDPKKAVSEKEKEMSVQQQETAIQPKETGSPPKDTKLVAKETVLRTKVTEPVSKKAESVEKPKVTVPTGTTSGLNETVPDSSKSVSESQKTVVVQQQDTASQPMVTESVMKETKSVAKETTLVAKEIAAEVKVAEPVSKKGKRADKSKVAAPKDTSLLPKETVPETTKTVSVATSSVTAPKETVDDPKKTTVIVHQQDTASQPTGTESVMKETESKTVVVQQQDTASQPMGTESVMKETESVAKQTKLVAKDIAPEVKVTEPVSEKGKGADKSTVAAPKDTSLLPKETVPETTKTVSVATSKVTAPKETVDDLKKAVSEKEKAMSVQQQETTIQPKETGSPPKDTKLLAKETVLRTKVAKPESKTAQSVAKPKVSVPTDITSVLKETVPHASKSVSESQKTVIVHHQDTASQPTGTESVMKETKSVAKETILVAKEIAAEVKVAEPVSKKGKRADKSTVAAPKDTSLLPKETVPEATKTVSVATSSVTAPKETQTVSAVHENVLVPDENLLVPKEAVPVPDETVSVPKKTVYVPEEPVSILQKTLSTKITLAPQETVLQSKEPVSEVQPNFPKVSMAVLMLDETESIPKQTVPVPKETIPAHLKTEPLSIPHIDTKDPKVTSTTHYHLAEIPAIPAGSTEREDSAPMPTILHSHPPSQHCAASQTMTLAPSQLDPTQEVVVSCREWASQLEDWLSRTWQHLEGLGPTEAMQDTIKQQFITYLEMLQEKQRKVSQLAMDQQRDAVGKHTELEALSSRLDLLKTSMLSLQLLLQKRWSKDLKGMKPGECPLEEGMSDSTSMTQTSSDSSKQQSSLQQWRIDVDLYEQRGLAQAIAGYYGGKRPTCLSDESQIRGVLTQEERALLCTQLEAKLRALEELRLEGPLEVTLQVPESHKSLQVEGPHTQHHPSSGPDEETKMQVLYKRLKKTKKDSSSGQIELKGSTKQQEGPEELLQVLNSLVELGRERLVHSQIQPRSRDDLQTLLNRQKKYFQALGGHMAALGYLWKRVPEETQRQVEGVREKLEREVGTLQQQAAWEGAKLQRTLEIHTHTATPHSPVSPFPELIFSISGVSNSSPGWPQCLRVFVLSFRLAAISGLGNQAWVEWDKSSSQLEELLQDVEARLPSGGSPEETKGQLTTCQGSGVRGCVCLVLGWGCWLGGSEVKEVLDQSGTQLLHRALDQGKELQASGHCLGVGVALWGLETRWLAAQRGAEQERSHAEELRDLWSRFQQDSATLGTWMDGAGERLQMLTELVAAAPQETGHHRAHLAQLLELTKEAGAMSTVKTSLSRTGAQLLQLKGDHPSSVQTQLEQLEQRWVGMLAAQSGVQERLHKLLMEKLSQEEVMAELGVWMEDLKSRLGEDKERILRASDASSLGPLLQHCKVVPLSTLLMTSHLTPHTSYLQTQSHDRITKRPRLQMRQNEYKVEMGLHQLSLDFISQSVVPTGSPEDVLERRYEWNSFAERLGILHLYWLTLQGVLASQDHNVEQLQQICADRESRLQCLCSWVRGCRERMEKLQKPGSLSQAQRAGQECEHTEQELKVKCVEMQELRESCRPVEGGGEQQSDCDAAFIAQTDSVRQDFTALSQQISAMWPMLRQVVGQWEQFEEALGEALLGTAKIRQALELIRTPHLCLHTLLGHAHRLQLLQEEAQGQEEVWEALRRTWSSLRDEVSPAAAVRLSQRLEEGRTRWVTVCLELTEELQKSQALIESWRAYTTLYDAFVLQLHSHRVQWGALMSNPLQGDDAVKPTQAQMEAVSELQAGMEGLHSSLGAVLEASKKLIGKVEPQASALIQSETQMLSQDVARLAGDLLLRQKQLQEQLDLRKDFHSCLESLEQRLRGDESRLSSTPEHKLNPKLLKTRLLELTDLTSDLDSLNELGRSIALSDRTSRRLQELRMLWSRTSSHAVEMSCKLQAGALLRQNFGQKCESWVNFLQRVEESLPKEDAAGRSLDPLPRQLAALRVTPLPMYLPTLPRTHPTPTLQPCPSATLTNSPRLQVQVPEGCQILNSIIKEGLGLLDKDEVEDRCGFVQKLVQQMERWQGTVWRVRQQLAVAQGMKGQQQVYTHGLKMLKGLLSNTDHLLTPTNPSHCSLHQLRQSLEEVKDAERQFQQHHSLYLQTVETGRALLTQGSIEMQAQLQDELEALQKAWEHSQGTLGKRRANTEAVLQERVVKEYTAARRSLVLGERRNVNWECSQARIADSRCRLEGVKNRLKQPLPELLGELHTTEKLNKEAEGSLEEWSHGFAEITHERTNLEQQVAPGDMALLQKPEEALSREWEELCLKEGLVGVWAEPGRRQRAVNSAGADGGVSQRKQEIANRLGTWTIFNEKKQELCAWLTQMEKKHSPPQDCMEEMHRFREDKTRLRQLGERLIASGDRAQEAEDMLRNVEDRWKHVAERLKAGLAGHCWVFQREKASASPSLTDPQGAPLMTLPCLCLEVLCFACDSWPVFLCRVTRLQQWKERVKKLQRDMCVLQTQLSRTETQLATPLSYSTCHSDEIQRKLTEQKALEQEVQQQSEGVASVLAQCDSLAEDADGCGGDLEVVSLREKARSLNNRCRNIRTLTTQRRSRIKETRQLWREFLDDHSKFEDWLRKVEETAAKPDSDYILYANAKEECKKFEALQREGQEHFANLELLNTRYRRLARENRTDTANSLQVTVLQGNQRWDTLQQRVVAILRRLKSFTAEWEEFVGVKEKTQMWLTEMDLRLTNVEHLSKCDTHERMEQLDGLQREMGLGVERVAQLTSTGKQLRQRSAPQDRALIQEQLSYLSSFHQQLLQRAERFRQRLTCPRPETEEEPEDQSGPGQGLEGGAVLAEGSWQEGSRDGQAEQPIQQASSHPLALPQESLSLGSTLREGECACPSDVDQSSPQKEEDERATMHGAISGTSLTEAPILPSPESQKEEEYLHKGISLTMTAPPTHASTPCKQGYAELVSECSGSIDHVKRVSLILDDEEQLPAEQGLTGLAVADKQSGVIQRWEVLQAQSPQPRVPREPPRPTSDLSDITAWLGRVVPELQQLQRSKPATSIRDMEASVKRLKGLGGRFCNQSGREMQRTFSRYKGVMIALNLGSQEPQPDDDGKVSDEGLQNMNQSWVEACILLEQWEERLRGALMRCKEFHKTLQSLLLWLASAESRRLAVDVHDPSVGPTALQEHNNALMALRSEVHSLVSPLPAMVRAPTAAQTNCTLTTSSSDFIGSAQLVVQLQHKKKQEHCGLEKELQVKQQQVNSLQEISTQLLLEGGAAGGAGRQDGGEAQEKLHVIGNKLQLLLSQVASDQEVIKKRLEQEKDTAVVRQPAGNRNTERRDPSPPRSFFQRVLRAAFPLHLLLLLLLTLACLVPAWEEDSSCLLSNNFARSLYPMLRYTQGPPPT
ncbi:hypothetical protein JZ751_010387 [Albula glossodonta]|uniref:KASH domain-containing protein n=1 Tax=Albula glossodonta TaxID=121402 RepID=A0A8T2NZY7_9TELE|nr:hypothetical protein JZ751_010387 [Albula glossodonta]